MESILSFPNRGAYGDSSYRGNTSGFVIKSLIEHFLPKLFVDVCEGSGTSRDVCQELKIPYVGLDLHRGFDFTQNSVLSMLPRPADIVFSHPPYHNMIDYSIERAKHGLTGEGNDTSKCSTVEEFLELSNVMLLNQREATRNGGIYATLIGDHRTKGQFRSYQADFIKMMPTQELASVTIKLQHNTTSSSINYPGSFVPIMHEYLIIWKKGAVTMAQITWDKASEHKNLVTQTWKAYIRTALMNLGGKAPLNQIYNEVEKVAGHKIKENKNFEAKIRQQLQWHYQSVTRGVWAITTT